MAEYDNDNIFAKLLRGEIPAIRLYEDEHAVAIMDVMPQAPGHVLVIPRAPSRNLLDADPDVLAKTIPVVQKLARAVKAAFDADGVFVGQFNEAAAGQTVYHLHFHVVPRHEGIEMKRHSDGMEDMEVLKANAEKILTALKASP
ncbi:HIT family protein [Martelella mediterranea]|uniref:HIT-like protein n=1 Tax=Martelella mediterranea DSM 17316 TaxID=1122214 RepID=A0A1U9Z493_9HYPH|nr:HIT family protein [Martelella mediterranea]AQZ52498.1 HIT-like protein [Martelella mediterranea DSM 17316]